MSPLGTFEPEEGALHDDAGRNGGAGTANGTVLLTSGLAVTCAAVFLYATALSRAIAVWISPLGAALFVTGLWALRTGRRPRRALLVALGVVAVALVVLGLWTLSIAIQAEDQAA